MSPPLDGIRVVDLTQMMAGPMCTTVLGDFGADVIKVERPQGGDVYRRIGTASYRGENSSFLMINRNKRSLAVDLKDPTGNEIVRRLVAGADVVVQNFRPGALQRLGLGYDTAAADNPRIIYCSISGFGSEGPYAGKPGTDPVIQAMSGVMGTTGEPGRPPVLVGPPVGDFNAAMIAVQAILLALLDRERTGRGQEVSVSLLDASVFSLGPRAAHALLDDEDLEPLGNRHPLIAPNEAFATATGYIHVSTLEEESWGRLCQSLDRPEWAGDARFADNASRVAHREELHDTLERRFMQMTREEAIGQLEAHGVLCAKVLSLAAVMADPQVRQNGMVTRVEHATVGEISVLNQPIRLGRDGARMRTAAPVLGDATRDVLEELGYSKEAIKDLVRTGVIRAADSLSAKL